MFEKKKFWTCAKIVVGKNELTGTEEALTEHGTAATLVVVASQIGQVQMTLMTRMSLLLDFIFFLLLIH
jgi:hypothetical protein